jgi:bis(5'-nucleosyl)-tetraphosphatase (symmetrical)
MSTYLFGDIQGCFDELQHLLDKINYDPNKDRLGFVGDLVNRGPKSLETLRFIKNLNDPIVVLGNHDLYLLALAHGCVDKEPNQTLLPLLNAPDKNELLEWLRHQPLIYYNDQHSYLVVHAGIPPCWSITTALQCAHEVEQVLQGEHYQEYFTFFENMLGATPNIWHENLTGYERLRYIVNALTRMRFCTQSGKLDLDNKGITSTDSHYRPWFEWFEPDIDIIFGHWASLQGQCHKKHFYALDTGCVWGETLTALRIEDKKLFSI